MLRPLLLAASISALALSACASPCRSMCDRAAECAQKLGSSSIPNVDTCTKDCEASTSCPKNRGGYLDCMANVKCENGVSYLGEMITCAGKCE